MTTICATCPRELDTASILCAADTCCACEMKRLAPRPSSEWAVFTSALREAAVNGVVHQAAVRPLVRGRIKPQSVGGCYSRAIREGVLVEVDRERSNDVEGRNTNKLEPVYKLERAA